MFCFCLQSSLLKLQALEVEGGPSLGSSPENSPPPLGSKEQGRSSCAMGVRGEKEGNTLALCHSCPADENSPPGRLLQRVMTRCLLICGVPRSITSLLNLCSSRLLCFCQKTSNQLFSAFTFRLFAHSSLHCYSYDHPHHRHQHHANHQHLLPLALIHVTSFIESSLFINTDLCGCGCGFFLFKPLGVERKSVGVSSCNIWAVVMV